MKFTTTGSCIEEFSYNDYIYGEGNNETSEFILRTSQPLEIHADDEHNARIRIMGHFETMGFEECIIELAEILKAKHKLMDEKITPG